MDAVNQNTPNTKQDFFEWMESLMISLSVMMAIFTFLVGSVFVDGSSMEPTLKDGERLLIVPTYYSLNARDIVVINRVTENPLVKRIIATEGQTIDIDFDAGEVRVDGNLLDEPYIAAPTTYYDHNRVVSFPAVVPEGYVFVMGDNRNNSLDSRDQSIGMVPTEKIFGKVFARVYPFNRMGLVGREQ